jgi:hypothetical protein
MSAVGQALFAAAAIVMTAVVAAVKALLEQLVPCDRSTSTSFCRLPLLLLLLPLLFFNCRFLQLAQQKNTSPCTKIA